MTEPNFKSNYGYQPSEKGASATTRPEYRYFLQWIKPQSKVLDLACGEGSLGGLLIDEKQCDVYGLEIDPLGVEQSLLKGIKAKVGDLDQGLKNFSDQSFDYVICNVSLQMLYRPGFVLEEALRVGKRAIISFPNFGYWQNRLQLLKGNFPSFSLYGHSWHETRSIHLFSLNDFLDLVKEKDAKVYQARYLGANSFHEDKISKILPNLFATVCILEIS